MLAFLALLILLVVRVAISWFITMLKLFNSLMNIILDYMRLTHLLMLYMINGKV